jgi:hypothetical protein
MRSPWKITIAVEGRGGQPEGGQKFVYEFPQKPSPQELAAALERTFEEFGYVLNVSEVLDCGTD